MEQMLLNNAADNEQLINRTPCLRDALVLSDS